MGKKIKESVVQKSEDINIFDLTKNLKLGYVLVLIFVILGFYLRFYHIQYPVIGYHNWKTAHYLTEARNFAREGFFKYGFFIPDHNTLESINEPPDGSHGDAFPVLGIIVAIFFKIFGINLEIARLVSIVFNILCIPLTYILVKQLFNREDLALLSAFFTAINPLFVYFAQTLEIGNPALLFLLLGWIIYLYWLNNKTKNFLLYMACFFITLSALTKNNFLIGAVPIIFSFPYKYIFSFWKKYLPSLLVCMIIVSSFPMWLLYTAKYDLKTVTTSNKNNSVGSQAIGNIMSIIDLKVLTDMDFWQMTVSFIADNYSLIGVLYMYLGLIFYIFIMLRKSKQLLSIFGIGSIFSFIILVLVLVNLINIALGVLYFFISMVYFVMLLVIHFFIDGTFKKEDNGAQKFLLGYLAGFIIYVVTLGYKLGGHNYHQYPLAPLVIILISYFIIFITTNFQNMIKNTMPIIKISVILLLVFIFPLPGKAVFAQSIEAKNRMFNTQFPGLDIAGDYINEHSKSNERLFHSSHQSFGILWNADRKGYKPPSSAAYFKEAEDNYNVSWVFVYQWGIQSYFQNQEIFDYLKSHYRLAQFAFIPVSQEQVQPLYFLFRKGGNFNESELNAALQNHPAMSRTYYYTNSPYEVRYINLQ